MEAYFDSITREVGMTEKVDTGRKDSSGHKIFENVPVINKRGEQVRYTEYLVPPTVGGLCEYLEIHRSTWAEYCDESLHPEFSDTTTRTRGRMREYLEQQLLIRKDVKGIYFSRRTTTATPSAREVDFGPPGQPGADGIGGTHGRAGGAAAGAVPGVLPGRGGAGWSRGNLTGC